MEMQVGGELSLVGNPRVSGGRGQCIVHILAICIYWKIPDCYRILLLTDKGIFASLTNFHTGIHWTIQLSESLLLIPDIP